VSLRRIDHVQLAIPTGGEDLARSFYVDLFGLSEVPKPEPLAGRGGCWFRSAHGVEVHLGIDEAFTPARTAHPAFEVDDLAALWARLELHGVEVRPAETLDGVERVHVDDPFGNRIELLGRRTGEG
jgi:catechol 2,3-dioxygenase-like lactoylglutathione lyase family enzyme